MWDSLRLRGQSVPKSPEYEVAAHSVGTVAIWGRVLRTGICTFSVWAGEGAGLLCPLPLLDRAGAARLPPAPPQLGHGPSENVLCRSVGFFELERTGT